MNLNKIQNIGFVIKMRVPEAAQLAVEICQDLMTRGVGIHFAEEAKDIATLLQEKKNGSKVHVHPKKDLPHHVDLIVVFGGDGTFLSIARHMKDCQVPLLGVNMGTLGFLTEIKKEEAKKVIDEILEKQSVAVSERALLEVTLVRDGKTVFQGPVVNDAVISKGAIARIIGMRLAVNGVHVSTVRADGLIVSTPTGSTAYNLAAGGPILVPGTPILAITPICAHGLTHRPLVVPNDAEIEIQLEHRPGHVLLTLDGQDAVDLVEGDRVKVRKYQQGNLKIVSSSNRDYFSVLNEKFKFGMR
tara:strand:+ start:201 stop:1103 length:903 start_codon:yes stop_codon:yes gene_type:complete